MSLGAVDSPWMANGGLNARVPALTAADVASSRPCCAGLAPALAARRANLTGALHGTGRSAIGGHAPHHAGARGRRRSRSP